MKLGQELYAAVDPIDGRIICDEEGSLIIYPEKVIADSYLNANFPNQRVFQTVKVIITEVKS